MPGAGEGGMGMGPDGMTSVMNGTNSLLSPCD